MLEAKNPNGNYRGKKCQNKIRLGIAENLNHVRIGFRLYLFPKESKCHNGERRKKKSNS